METGKRDSALMLTNINSAANATPPSGALKVAAIPPLAPAANKMTRSAALMPGSFPNTEPKVAPI